MRRLTVPCLGAAMPGAGRTTFGLRSGSSRLKAARKAGRVRRVLLVLAAALFCTPPATIMTASAGFAQSRDPYCRAYARDVSARYSAGGAVGGAVRGAAGGAVVGGIVNGKKGARRGARIGGATGAIAGATHRSVSYDTLYRDCMRGLIYY